MSFWSMSCQPLKRLEEHSLDCVGPGLASFCCELIEDCRCVRPECNRHNTKGKGILTETDLYMGSTDRLQEVFCVLYLCRQLL